MRICVVFILLLLPCTSVLVYADGIVRKHIALYPLKRRLGSHTPVGGAGGNDLYKREALSCYLILKGLLDGLLGVLYVLYVVYCYAGDILGAVECGEHLADLDGPSDRKSTQEAARALSKNLGAISKERVYTELKKLISGADAHTVMKKYADIIASVFEGVRVEVLPEKALFDRADYLTRLASVFYLNSLEPVECAERVLLALKTDKFTRTHTISVLSAYNHVSFSSEREALYALAKYGKDITEGALRLGILLGKFSEADTEILSYATASGKPYMISHLSVRGTDLASLGICGEKIGETLSSLLFAVIDGRVENEKNALVEYASGIK